MKTKIKTSKLIVSSLLLFILAAGVTFASNASKITVNFENLKYVIQGKQVNASPDTPGFLYNGTTYVPLRFITESMGFKVDWNSKSKTITMTGSQDQNGQGQAYLKEIDRLNAEVASLREEITALKTSGNSTTDEKIDETDSVKYQSFKKGNYTLHFTPTAYKDYGYLYTEFEQITEEMFNYFGVKDVSFPVKIYIQSGKDRIEHSNTGAFYESGERVVVMNPDDNFKMAGHDSVKFLFVHELSHSLQDAVWSFDMLSKVTNNEKNWILEGHADYIAKKLSGYTQYGFGDPAGHLRDQAYYYDEIQNRNGAEGWKPLDWSGIKTFQQLSLYRDEYFAFEAIVNFIAESYSLDHYRLLLDEMAKGKNGADAIPAVFKKSDTQLMNEYKAFYKLN